jgi:hypothetical protein
MLSPVSHRHRHLASQLVQASSQVHRRSLDHQVRLAISLVALAGALLLTLMLGLPTDELPSNQTVDVPALQAKS